MQFVGLEKMPGMNGTRLSDRAIAVTVGDFMKFAAWLGEQLERFRSSFDGPWLASLWPQRVLHAGDGLQQFRVPAGQSAWLVMAGRRLWQPLTQQVHSAFKTDAAKLLLAMKGTP